MYDSYPMNGESAHEDSECYFDAHLGHTFWDEDG